MAVGTARGLVTEEPDDAVEPDPPPGRSNEEKRLVDGRRGLRTFLLDGAETDMGGVEIDRAEEMILVIGNEAESDGSETVNEKPETEDAERPLRLRVGTET